MGQPHDDWFWDAAACVGLHAAATALGGPISVAESGQQMLHHSSRSHAVAPSTAETPSHQNAPRLSC